MPFDVRTGLVGALAAICFVLVGTSVAPRARRPISALLFAAGAWLAWFAYRHWYFPEGHPRAYQESLMPLVLTLCGGGVGLAVAWFRELRPKSTS